MSTRKTTHVGLMTAGLMGLGTAVAVAACYSPPEKNNATVAPITGACRAGAGEYPEPNCDSSRKECTQGACNIAAECGSPATCQPIGDNTGKSTADFRIRRLNVVSPLSLIDIQKNVLTKNIDLDKRTCAERGLGGFNWLFRVDRANNKIITGGGPPTANPYSDGYCFYDHVTPVVEGRPGIDVKPAEVAVTFEGDTFTSEKIPKLNVPIFVNGAVGNVVVLPLNDVVINKTTLSESDNCIGGFDQKALDSDCAEVTSLCTKWKTNASLGGYITLEEADGVWVTELNQSLCVLLSKTLSTSDRGKCTRVDGKIVLDETHAGDFCSETKAPGGCRDSFWLAATFAASAIKIHDGAGVEVCKR